MIPRATPCVLVVDDRGNPQAVDPPADRVGLPTRQAADAAAAIDLMTAEWSAPWAPMNSRIGGFADWQIEELASFLLSIRTKENAMATQESKNASVLSAQAIMLAEQLGRMAGTVQGTAEGWLDRQKLAGQLTLVRDGATRMLESMGGAAGRSRTTTAKRSPKRAAAAGRNADAAHAPGKRHRKPGPSMRGVKKSNEAIPKMRTAAAVRQRRKSYA